MSEETLKVLKRIERLLIHFMNMQEIEKCIRYGKTRYTRYPYPEDDVDMKETKGEG